MKAWSILRYNWKQSCIVVAILSFLSYAYWHKWNPEREFIYSDYFWEFIDPISAIGAFLFTLAILYNQGKERYLKSLENRLSIEYLYNGKVVMEVIEAYLADKSDIRSWGQSLGRQMSGGADLKFDMNWNDDTKMEIGKSEGVTFKHYRIKIYLSHNPLSKDKLQNNDFLEGKTRYQFSTVELEGPKNAPEKIIWKRNTQA